MDSMEVNSDTDFEHESFVPLLHNSLIDRDEVLEFILHSLICQTEKQANLISSLL